MGIVDQEKRKACYGEYKVSSITNISEPTDLLEKIISIVSFEYEVSKYC